MITSKQTRTGLAPPTELAGADEELLEPLETLVIADWLEDSTLVHILGVWAAIELPAVTFEVAILAAMQTLITWCCSTARTLVAFAFAFIILGFPFTLWAIFTLWLSFGLPFILTFLKPVYFHWCKTHVIWRLSCIWTGLDKMPNSEWFLPGLHVIVVRS